MNNQLNFGSFSLQYLIQTPAGLAHVTRTQQIFMIYLYIYIYTCTYVKAPLKRYRIILCFQWSFLFNILWQKWRKNILNSKYCFGNSRAQNRFYDTVNCVEKFIFRHSLWYLFFPISLIFIDEFKFKMNNSINISYTHIL